MDIREITDKTNHFVNDQGWYETCSTRPQTLKNLAISLNLETSEVLEFFQWKQDLDNFIEFASELADVALYLFQLANLAGVDLEKAIMEKLEFNYQRTWENRASGEGDHG